MNDLLRFTIEAHGGLDRWKKYEHVSAHLTCGGITWELKKQAGIVEDVYVRCDTRRQFTSHYPFVNKDWHSSFEPNRVAILNAGGQVIEEMPDPRSSFKGHVVETPWSRLQLAYFAGYAMWTYLNAPFCFAEPGYKTEELEPVDEDGEQFLRLLVTYPEDIATHASMQTFYIDESGLIRRHDYNAEVLGGIAAAHYLSDYIEVQGIKIATRRRVYRLLEDNIVLKPDPLLVSIDLSTIKLALPDH